MIGKGPRVCVITGFGINADEELAQGFAMAGAMPERVHVRDLIEGKRRLDAFSILAFPGGFSFGDHLGSGRVFATLFRKNLKPGMQEFVERGGLVIGICNGFQVLVKMGVLPGLSGAWDQEVSLIHNDSGRFEDRWVRIAFDPACRCAWTSGLPDMELPVRHGEGKFVVESSGVLDAMRSRGLVAARYATRAGGTAVEYPEDPNGSVDHIAGICDSTGRIFGLMPHPEAYMYPENHPEWTRQTGAGRNAGRAPRGALTPGLRLLANGVKAARGR